MIISRTPYRISFFGGGTDYPQWYLNNGGKVISSTINKYVYISLRDLPSFFKHKYRIAYSKVEYVKEIKNIKHKVVREMINLFKMKQGLEIHYDGDLPSKSGMGSSSAFVVGLMLAMHEQNKFKLTKKSLAYKSMFFEQKILKEIVGSQDQIATTYGGFNLINFCKNGNFNINKININDVLKKQLNKSLFIVYTGRQRRAHSIASKYVAELEKKNFFEMQELIKIVDIAKKILEERQLDDFGLLLNETWKIKKSLANNISNNYLNGLYNYGIESGAYGGKLLGAGGGGFMLFYVPIKNIKLFLKKFKKNLIIPFEFEDKGSQIIYNSENEKR